MRTIIIPRRNGTAQVDAAMRLYRALTNRATAAIVDEAKGPPGHTLIVYGDDNPVPMTPTSQKMRAGGYTYSILTGEWIK